MTIIGSIWTVPNTFLGLLLGAINFSLPTWQLHRSMQRHDETFAPVPISILLGPGIVRLICRRLGISAFTMGDCVLYRARPTKRLTFHEYRHVRQYRLLGPFFLPVYFLLFGAFGYCAHPLERDARMHEGAD